MPFKKAVFSCISFLYKQRKVFLYLVIFSIEITGSFLFVSWIVNDPDLRELFSHFFSNLPTASIFDCIGVIVRIGILQQFLTQFVIMTLAYWLYSRKKQTVPFGKEYIESLEG